MPAISRIGDQWDCGDTQAQGSGNVFVNGIPVARLSDLTAGHAFNPVAIDSASTSVFINSKGAARVGDHHPSHCYKIPCHDGSLTVGSPNVFVNEGLVGGMSNVPVSDVVAATYQIDKADFATYGVTLTYGHLADPYQDDDFSNEAELSPYYPVVSLSVYKDVVPNAADVTNSPTPAGLNSVQARKFTPIRPPGSANGPVTTSEIATSKNYGHDPDLQKNRLGDVAPSTSTYNTSSTTPDNTDIDNWVGTFPSTFPLSSNFTLGQLSFGFNSQPRVRRHPIKPQGGLTVKDIVKNLRALAVNVLEPMRLHFPDMLINSGFRVQSGSSQHANGQAADVYVPSLQGNNEALYQGALWVRDNINYDQFIFESKGQDVWYHVSFNVVGNRPKTAPNACMTTATGGSPYTFSIVKLT